MSVIDNDYPSTSDISLPAIMGGQDAVLAILEGAKERFKRAPTKFTYIGKTGEVCAIGALLAEAGGERNPYGRAARGQLGFIHALEVASCGQVEPDTIKATKEALGLLNKSVNKLYPDIAKADRERQKWNGPLEHLNQTLFVGEYSKAVLKCYQDAIKTRKAETAVL